MPGSRTMRVIESNDWLALDLETTGLDSQDEVLEVAIVSPEEATLFHSVVETASGPHPGSSFTREEIAAARPFADLAGELRCLLHRRSVLAYNASFDRRFLWAAFAYIGRPAPRCQWHCLLEETKRLTGGRKSLARSLEHFGVPAVEPRHRALPDVISTVRLARALVDRDYTSATRTLGSEDFRGRG